MNIFQPHLSYPEHSPAQLSPQSKFQFRETKDKSFGAEQRGICFLSIPLLPHKLNIQVSIKSGELKRQGEDKTNFVRKVLLGREVGSYIAFGNSIALNQ